MKEFYVYEYWCPITNEIFYVGKGTGMRMNEHLVDARNSNINSCKLNKIRESATGRKRLYKDDGTWTMIKENLE